MTSEPDSTPRRRPPTIDLTATEVETDEAASGRQTAPGKPENTRAHSNSGGRLAIGAAAGAIVMAAIIAALWFAGYMPAHDATAPSNVQVAAPAAIDAISTRLDKIQDTIQSRQPKPAFASRVAAAEAATKSLADSLAALNRRVDDLAAAAQGALAQAKAATATAEAAKNAAQTGIQRGEFDALAGRIAALESAVKTVTSDVARQTSSADDRAARLTVAAEALRATVERGAPYQAELAAVKSLGVGKDATAPLDAFAASGVPSAAALAHELSMLTPSLLRASGETRRDGSLLGRLETSAQKLVRITPLDAPPGDEPSAVIARIDDDAARADIAGARADIERLPQSAKTLAEAWIRKADSRDSAITASRRISADALAALDKPNSQ